MKKLVLIESPVNDTQSGTTIYEGANDQYLKWESWTVWKVYDTLYAQDGQSNQVHRGEGFSVQLDDIHFAVTISGIICIKSL